MSIKTIIKDSPKVRIIIKWAEPTCFYYIILFLRLNDFDQRFIQKISKFAKFVIQSHKKREFYLHKSFAYLLILRVLR